MGGSGSGNPGNPFRLDPAEAVRRREEAERAAKTGQIDAEVNALLSKRLIEVNRRDTVEVERRLAEIQDALAADIEGVDRLLFGGSVAKQTYVEGLSDIDSLVILASEKYGDLTPPEMMERLQQALEAKLNRSEAIDVRAGDLAVTVEYDDGLQVQLLPAVERESKLSIAGPSGNSWAQIDPEAFAKRLSAVNQSQAGAVVPAIKLAKAILASEPESRRPDGYHLEALAVAAFEDYLGPRNPKAMVTHLFESAARDVRRPIPDLTGQSRQVDADLGGEGSIKRRRMSEGLRATARRMRNAPNVGSWEALLGED
jgi:hypothetical protein